MFRITSNQWQKTGKDYKSIINGTKYIMKDCALIPVEIDNINGQELKSYLFDEFGITYSVLGWNIEDAKRIIKDCGHIEKYVNNIRIK
jgi:hypothetical protein